MADKKLPLEVSVQGTAAYAWLYKKDTKYAKNEEDGKYKLTIVVPKDELGDLTAGLNGGGEKVSGEEWLAHLQKMHKDAGGTAQKCPVKDGDKPRGEADKPKEEFVGCWTIDFKTGFQPKIVDTKKQELPEGVKAMSGDIVKAAYRPFIYDGGVSLRLNAVMVIDKRASFDGAGAFGDDEEGYVADDKSDGASAFSGSDDDNGDY